ncbi:MAG: precorrin-6y C5,15-methyltransferase (decarboxylating) subunit CbiE [Methanobacteriota archaeon]|nr:MAG: precorrin-6y C5,15-methyltransferase (decarboxylating) subunit CbiE [Euryarchaeota archaeon]
MQQRGEELKMGRVAVVGIGPGCREHLTPAALKAVEEAEILIGGKRQLALFPEKTSTILLGADHGRLMEVLRSNRGRRIAVLTSGDPGFYSILSILLENLPREEIEVVPGISSMQLCFARAGLTWHDAAFYSVHGRSTEGLLEMVRRSRKTAVLTDPRTPPQEVARLLLAGGAGNRRAVVCEDLCGDDERVVEGSLEEVAKGSYKGYSVMVILE